MCLGMAFVAPSIFQIATREGRVEIGRHSQSWEGMLQSWEVMAAILGSASQD